ncbi:MAG: hypothetical protein ACI88C_003304 [Acidimicrobiales bacterium]|jgi:hypothetical protein
MAGGRYLLPATVIFRQYLTASKVLKKAPGTPHTSWAGTTVSRTPRAMMNDRRDVRHVFVPHPVRALVQFELFSGGSMTPFWLVIRW